MRSKLARCTTTAPDDVVYYLSEPAQLEAACTVQLRGNPMTIQQGAKRKPKVGAASHVQSPIEIASLDAAVLPMNRTKAADLINDWLNDSSKYDEQAWPVLQAAIEEHRTSLRPRFYE